MYSSLIWKSFVITALFYSLVMIIFTPFLLMIKQTRLRYLALTTVALVLPQPESAR